MLASVVCLGLAVEHCGKDAMSVRHVRKLACLWGGPGSAEDGGGSSGEPAEPEEPSFKAFAGAARRLDGRAVTPSGPLPSSSSQPSGPAAAAAGISSLTALLLR